MENYKCLDCGHRFNTEVMRKTPVCPSCDEFLNIIIDGDTEAQVQEFLKYTSIIKSILDLEYGKERVFYDSGEWYDRHHCRNINLEELEKEVLGIANFSENEREYQSELIIKIYELMGEDEAEVFLDSIEHLICKRD